MPIKRTCPGAGCKNRGREGGSGRKERREGVLERGSREFGDQFAMIFSGLTLIYVTAKPLL